MLLAATVPRLRYMLHACGESLWRARSLSIGLKYSTGAQAKFSAGDLEPRGGFQLWLPDKAEIRSELRRLSLPLDIISDITPLLPRLQSIEILVSIHSHSQILIHLLQKLQRLPRALTQSVAHERGFFITPTIPSADWCCPSWEGIPSSTPSTSYPWI